ncbi:MAG: class I SAM-dependent methyltransferase, partial [Promethearchaeota archaeon]
VFSDTESSFGKGTQIEQNTFESKPWRPVHYFTEFDLREHFKDYSVIKTGIIEETEDHGELGPHTHILRYIFAKKEKS